MNATIIRFRYRWKGLILVCTLFTGVLTSLEGSDKRASTTINPSTNITTLAKAKQDSLLSEVIGRNPQLKESIAQDLKKIPEKSAQMVSLNHLGIYYFEQSKFDAAKIIFQDLLQQGQEERDWDEMASAYNLLSVMAELNNQFVEMYFFNQKLMELGEKYDPKLQANAHLNFGIFYSEVQDWKAAEERLKLGLSIYEHLPKTRSQYGWLLHRLGEVYKLTGFWEKAEHYLSKAMTYWEKTSNKRGKRFTNLQLAEVYMNLGKIEKARTTYEKVWQNCIKNNDYLCQVITSLSLAELEYRAKNHQTAIYYLENSIVLRMEKTDNYNLKESYELLAKAYQSTGNFQKSNKNYELYLAEVAKGAQEKKINAQKLIENQNKLQNKEAAYQLLKQSEEINQRKLNTQRIIILKILLLTLCLGWATYHSFKTNKRISAQKEALHQLNARIQEQADKLIIANEKISNRKKEVDLELVKKMLLLSQQVKAIDNLKVLIEEIPFSKTTVQMEKIIRESENKSIWNELNIQLTQSNHDFFAKLSKQFTDLSQTDLPVCVVKNESKNKGDCESDI